MSYLLLILGAFAGGDGASSLESVRATFAAEKGRVFATTKTVTGDLGTKSYKGEFTIHKGRIHWMTSKPKKVLQLFDGKYFFSIRYPNSAKQKTEVVKTLAKKRKNSVFSIFDAKKPLKSLFKIKALKNKNTIEQFQLKPLVRDVSIQKFIVRIDPVKNQITEIEFRDDMDSKTLIQFGPVRILNKISEGLFAYSPPEGTLVLEQ